MRPHSLFACLSAFSVLVAGAPAAAQETSQIYAHVKVSDNALAGQPVMVSFIRDGEIVFQSEDYLSRSPNVMSLGSRDRPLGVYDVRVEGEGVVTEVKRGIQLTAGPDTIVRFLVRPGSGVHVVEYAEGGLAREEVAARLAALEAEVAKLRGATQ